MNAAKQDLVGGLRPIELTVHKHRATSTGNGVQISPNGVTFSSANYIAPFTEVRVQVKLPHGNGNHSVLCEGVVVECQGNKFKKNYRVAVAFLNVPAHALHELRQVNQKPAS